MEGWMEGRWRREEGWRNEGGGRSDRASEGVREIYGMAGGREGKERVREGGDRGRMERRRGIGVQERASEWLQGDVRWD